MSSVDIDEKMARLGYEDYRGAAYVLVDPQGRFQSGEIIGKEDAKELLEIPLEDVPIRLALGVRRGLPGTYEFHRDAVGEVIQLCAAWK
jgi:hypothetical protein